MNYSLSDFRIVTPSGQGFSAAEARVGKTFVKFNNLAAAELHYPEYIRLLIGRDGVTLVIQPCERNNPNAIPFMGGRTADDLNGKKKWIRITNKMLGTIIREKANWEPQTSATTLRRFFAVPWPEENALIFDLTKPVASRKRIVALTADDILRTYDRAAQDLYPVPVGAFSSGVLDSRFTPIE